MSRLEGELAASQAENQALRGENAHLRCRSDHWKAIVRHDRDIQLPEERLLLIATTNRWDDTGFCEGVI